MKNITQILLAFLIFLSSFSGGAIGQPSVRPASTDKTIFAYGNGMDKRFVRYVAGLTGKKDPEICFVTTAAADNPRVIQYIQEMVAGLPLQPKFLLTFISSSPEQESFEAIILHSDAIIVGGGNTLDMLGVWQAQGIDTLLRQAYEKGIILAGGSAGSLCWFTGGLTDSRPRELTLMECLGFLPYSHSPHYNDATRRKLYNDAILTGKLSPGYGIEEGAGLLFVNGRVKSAVTLDSKYNSYFVSVKDGRIDEEKIQAEVIR
jgi:dipeptidase E